MVTVIRYPSLDQDLELPLLCTSYLAHPASSDGHGQGVGLTIVETVRGLGMTNAQLRKQLCGGALDGGLLGVHVSLFEL